MAADGVMPVRTRFGRRFARQSVPPPVLLRSGGRSGRAIASTALGVAFCIAAAALRADPLPWPQVWDEVDASVTRLVAEIELFRFADDQLAVIRSLALQEAADTVCDGFDTDQTLLTGYLSRIVPMTDEQIRRASLESIVLRSEVMFAFGTHFGAFVALGKTDPAAFWARAEAARQDPAILARIWVQE